MSNLRNSFNSIEDRVTNRECINTYLVEKKGRCRWEIIRDILKASSEERKKTRIMYNANLDWRNFQRYFDFLIKDDFIEKCNPNDSYVLTEKGKDFLKRLKDVEEILIRQF